ncbi:HNH endonuclease [Rufibacter quisquiliarum]|uniref:HNH domain-containing protein n=1 Tax=Rufibacter quisquiliarum TaxID=1549639 RepID=A0A839GF05_9BACT|nr:HNH endonuclease [Rufibacter quisquiliarum]MBA9078204.1 hypothetical protein [Rufibacter quisquiliarum]
MDIIENYGILASMSWNSNKWAGEPSKEDLNRSKYGYVQDESHAHESLNFGHEIFPPEEDGYYIGYTPMLRKAPAPDKSGSVKIIFLCSSDYKNSNRKLILGFYGNPEFGQNFPRQAKHRLYRKYDGGNIRAYPSDIIHLENPLLISNDIVAKNNLLPKDKKISQRGFNYLNSDNVYNLISVALTQNPNNTKLRAFVEKFPALVDYINQKSNVEDYFDVIKGYSADNLKDIAVLERKMAKQTPEVKQRISTYIERGAIAAKVKKLTGYRCLICESLNLNPISFKKPNGEYYVETHHVEPVSSMKNGVLSMDNLITVCANHHRQLHYGDSTLIGQTDHHFVFKIDGKKIDINKISLH